MTYSMKLTHVWFIVISLSMILFLANLDVTAVNLALPVIASYFHIDLSKIQWMVSGYVIIGAMFIVAAGHCSDLFGQKKVCIIGIFIFILGSLFSGIAYSAPSLIVARMLQGLGTALCYPSVFIMTLSIFPKQKRGVGLAILNAVTAVAWVSGPMIGGFFLHFFSWRWIFFLNLPIGSLSMFCVYMIYPKDHAVKNKTGFDYKGLISMVVFLMSLLVLINNIKFLIEKNIVFMMLSITAIVSISLFIWFELNQKHPILKLSLLKNKQVFSAFFIRMSFLFGLNALLFTIVFYLQNILMLSSLHAAKLLMFMMVVYGVISPLSGKLIDTYGARKLTIIGMFLFTLSFILLAKLTIEFNFLLLILALVFAGVTASIIFSSTNILAAAAVGEHEIGITTSIVITGGFIGAALGVSLTGTLFSVIGQHYLSQHIGYLLNQLSQTQQQYLSLLVSGARPFNSILQQFSPQLAKKLVPILENAYLSSLSLVMTLCAVLCFISFSVAVLLKKKKLSN